MANLLYNFKNTLGKLKVAEKKKHTMLLVESSKKNDMLLECLLKEGFIFRYIKKSNNYTEIYLKSFKNNLILFKRLNKINENISKKKLSSKKELQKNSIFFVKTSNSIMTESMSIRTNVGGFILFKS